VCVCVCVCHGESTSSFVITMILHRDFANQATGEMSVEEVAKQTAIAYMRVKGLPGASEMKPLGRVSEALLAADGSTYLLFLPPGWKNANQSNPVMRARASLQPVCSRLIPSPDQLRSNLGTVFLHGVGGINNPAGCTNPGLTTQFPLNDPAFAAMREHIVLVPVAAKRDWTNHFDSLMSLVDLAVTKLGGDPHRVTLAGQGMGGQGVWQIASLAPERFCAIVAICGWVDDRVGNTLPPEMLQALKSKPIWALCVGPPAACTHTLGRLLHTHTELCSAPICTPPVAATSLNAAVTPRRTICAQTLSARSSARLSLRLSLWSRRSGLQAQQSSTPNILPGSSRQTTSPVTRPSRWHSTTRSSGSGSRRSGVRAST
jgi:pimeloyl-ACP methyl ester carboxylesterase